MILYIYLYMGSAGLRRGFWHIIKNAGLLSHEYICTSILLNLHTRNMIDYNSIIILKVRLHTKHLESKQKSMTNLRDPCNLKKKIGKKHVKIKCELHQDFFFESAPAGPSSCSRGVSTPCSKASRCRFEAVAPPGTSGPGAVFHGENMKKMGV